MISKPFAILVALATWLFCMEAPIYIILYIWHNYNPYTYWGNITHGYVASAVGVFAAAYFAEKVTHIGETVIAIFVGIFAIFWIGREILNAPPEIALFKIIYLLAAIFAIITFYLYSKHHH